MCTLIDKYNYLVPGGPAYAPATALEVRLFAELYRLGKLLLHAEPSHRMSATEVLRFLRDLEVEALWSRPPRDQPRDQPMHHIVLNDPTITELDHDGLLRLTGPPSFSAAAMDGMSADDTTMHGVSVSLHQQFIFDHRSRLSFDDAHLSFGADKTHSHKTARRTSFPGNIADFDHLDIQ